MEIYRDIDCIYAILLCIYLFCMRMASPAGNDKGVGEAFVGVICRRMGQAESVSGAAAPQFWRCFVVAGWVPAVFLNQGVDRGVRFVEKGCKFEPYFLPLQSRYAVRCAAAGKGDASRLCLDIYNFLMEYFR